MSFVIICRVFLALVLGGAAIGKFQDLDDSRQQILDFGLPYSLARPLGTVLPGLEIALALGLVIGPTARWAAWAALALLTAFVAAISLNMARGRRPDCRCFGPLHVQTIGWRTLSRNLLLMALAAAVLLHV